MRADLTHVNSFGMRDDRKDYILVAVKLEIESPAASYPPLPNILAATIFLGVQRRMLQTRKQKPKLLGERFRMDGGSSA